MIKPMTTSKLNERRERFLQVAQAAGCHVKKQAANFRIDGNQPPKRFYIMRHGTKVTLSSFTIDDPAVMEFTEEDQTALHVRNVVGIFDMRHDSAERLFREALRQVQH